MKQSFFVILISFLTLFACKQEGEGNTTQTKQQKSKSSKTVTISEKYGCEDGNTASCVDIHVAYPSLEDLGSADREVIHHYIQDYLSDFLVTDRPIDAKHLKPFVTQSASAIIESAKESGGAAYQFNSTFDRTFRNLFLVCIKNDYRLVEGNEPAFTGEGYTIFDLTVSDILPMEQLVADEQGLNQLLLAEIKNMEKAPQDKDLSSLGYYISDKDFAATNNVGITDDQIIFAYSPSEIAPVEKGMIKIVKNKAEVSPFLNKDFVQKWENRQ